MFASRCLDLPFGRLPPHLLCPPGLLVGARSWCYLWTGDSPTPKPSALAVEAPSFQDLHSEMPQALPPPAPGDQGFPTCSPDLAPASPVLAPGGHGGCQLCF